MSTADSTDVKPPLKTGAEGLDDLFQPFNRGDAPGLVVGVALHGRTVFRRAYGLASVELGVANTPATRMRIGSTSKHFACLAALLLAEEGKLDLDAPARVWLPELPRLGAEPSLRQFMTHTSGYRDYLDLAFLSCGLAIRPAGTALAMQARQTAANFPPGEKMVYNNGGYHLLSLAIERAAGVPFEDVLRSRIFTPMGLKDTDSVPSDLALQRGMAALHVALPGGGWRRGLFPSEEVRGEGAMVSTVDDMLRWAAHVRSPQSIGNIGNIGNIGSPAAWAQMLAPTRLTNGLLLPYGLGLMRSPYRGVNTIHHAGGVVGGSSQMLIAPEHGLDIVILANSSLVNPVALALQVVDTMLGDGVGGGVLAPPGPIDPAAAAEFKGLVGRRYHAPASGLVVSFGEAQEHLALGAWNSPPAPLRQEAGRLKLAFEDTATGPIVLETAGWALANEAPAVLPGSEAGNPETFHLLPEHPPAAAELGAELLGHYHCPDMDAHASLLMDGGTLQLDVRGPDGRSQLVLEPFGKDVFGWHLKFELMPLRGVLNVDRVGAAVSSLRVDTVRTRRLVFHKVPAGAAASGQ